MECKWKDGGGGCGSSWCWSMAANYIVSSWFITKSASQYTLHNVLYSPVFSGRTLPLIVEHFSILTQGSRFNSKTECCFLGNLWSHILSDLS